jgi:hypothetical protein
MRRHGVVLALLASVLTGCAGYHIGPIQPKFMEGIHSIAVPAFKNDTLEPRIEVLFANSVIKQFQQDGTYEIASEARADAILQATIKKIVRRPSRSVRGNVLATREFILTITIDYRIARRDSDATLDQRSVTGTTSFFLTGDLQQDERQALPLAANDAAVRLVSQLSEGW